MRMIDSENVWSGRLTWGLLISGVVMPDCERLERMVPIGCLVQGGTCGRRSGDSGICVLPVAMGEWNTSPVGCPVV